MSAAAISLLSNQQRLEAMAKAGRKTAQDHFCSSRVIPLYEDYYDRVHCPHRAHSLISRRVLHTIYDQDNHWPLSRLQVEPKLLLQDSLESLAPTHQAEH